MSDLGYYALTLTGLAYLWWRHLRSSKPTKATCDEGLDLVLEVAAHEAEARDQDLGGTHLLYALLQDETVVAAIKKLDGDIEAIEGRVFAALDKLDKARGAGTQYQEDTQLLVGHILFAAEHEKRLANVCDLWHGLMKEDPSAIELAEDQHVPAVAVLFVLVHDAKDEPGITPITRDVEVMLMNDNHTPQTLVVEILHNIFGLPKDEATQAMQQVHNEGAGIVGTYRLSEAQAKVSEATARAREQGYPLWIRIQDRQAAD